MIPLSELWLPIVAAAAIVWVGSAIVWMVLPHHKSDFRGVADEEATRAALQGAAPGLYNLPHLPSWTEAKEPANRQKFEDGPVAFLTVLPNGVPNMGRSMFLSALYFVVVSFVVAYVVSRALPAGTHYLTVFRLAGTVAWLAYGFGTLMDSIWFGRPWSNAIKNLLDGLLYGLLTAGAFGWLWPQAVEG